MSDGGWCARVVVCYVWVCVDVCLCDCLHMHASKRVYLLLFLQQHWEINQKVDPQVWSNPN